MMPSIGLQQLSGYKQIIALEYSQQPLQDFLTFKYDVSRLPNEYQTTEEVINLRSNKSTNKISNSNTEGVKNRTSVRPL
jgi:hypothetical protein